MSQRDFESIPARTTFVLGGARSGKSAHAEQLAAASGLPVSYLATAASPGQAGAAEDSEFAERIAVHRARRPVHWRTIETGIDLAGALVQGGEDCVLVDCLTLWLTALFFSAESDGPRADWRERIAAFDEALGASSSRVIIVSNEIGLGVVPMGAQTRLFVDELGRLNQRIAARCEEVVMMVAGIPMKVKP
jgi:adenosylcobinamide kinase / adenosylcobinamide-phosphate guanylyltransferase